MAKKKKDDILVQEIDLLFAAESADAYKVAPSPEPEPVKKSNLLFDLIKAIFTDKEYVRNITYQQASQCLFMVLRRLAINYPEQANVFNRSDVNPKDVINFFSDYLYTGTVPKWVYTSVKDAPKSKSKNKFTESDIKDYLEYYDINRKDYEIANKLFHDELESDIREYVDLMKKLNSTKLEKDEDDVDY